MSRENGVLDILPDCWFIFFVQWCTLKLKNWK